MLADVHTDTSYKRPERGFLSLIFLRNNLSRVHAYGIPSIYLFSTQFYLKTFSTLPLKIEGQNLNFETFIDKY